MDEASFTIRRFQVTGNCSSFLWKANTCTCDLLSSRRLIEVTFNRRLQPSELHRSCWLCERRFTEERLGRRQDAVATFGTMPPHESYERSDSGPAGRMPAELRHDAASTERAQRTAVMDAAACIPSVAWKRSDAQSAGNGREAKKC